MECNPRRRRGFAIALVSGAVLLGPRGDFLAAEMLTVEKGTIDGDVVLRWTGGSSPWEVFRSSDPTSVIGPASRLGTTATTSWADSPPDEALLFYLVGSCGTPASPQPHGCATCDICDTWGLSWAPIICADHYVVRWKCVFHAEQAWSIFGTSVGDICFDIGMCDPCASGVESIRVEACSGTGCSLAAAVPVSETPSLCGGGCCVPR